MHKEHASTFKPHNYLPTYLPAYLSYAIYLFEREQESGAHVLGRSKGRERESQTDSLLSEKPDAELDPRIHEIMT